MPGAGRQPLGLLRGPAPQPSAACGVRGQRAAEGGVCGQRWGLWQPTAAHGGGLARRRHGDLPGAPLDAPARPALDVEAQVRAHDRQQARAAGLAQCAGRQFNPTRPDQAWVADITYIRTRSGWLYLAVVLDLFARKVVGWAMAPDMQAGLVCRALQLAIAQRQPAPGLIVHTDRGSQYASAAHQALLARHGLVGSMSRKGNCWDNAVMERFFLNLKMERVWQRDYANHAEATGDIADYIVSFYNSVRLHSTLGNVPPNAFEHQSAITQPIGLCEIT